MARRPKDILADIRMKAAKQQNVSLKDLIIDFTKKEMDRLINETEKAVALFEKYSDPYFIVAEDYGKKTVIEWLFENDISYKIELFYVTGSEYHQIKLKNNEDYMAFKLMFGDGKESE